MKLHCALCGRPVLNPAVLIGQLPVGPKCARRAGLIDLARRKSGNLALPRVRFKRSAPQENLDLFEGEETQ